MRYFGHKQLKTAKQSSSSSSLIGEGVDNPFVAAAPLVPGLLTLNRAEMNLADVQNYLDREGASDLVVDLIINKGSSRIFLDIVELGIALLEGGNGNVQVDTESLHRKNHLT